VFKIRSIILKSVRPPSLLELYEARAAPALRFRGAGAARTTAVAAAVAAAAATAAA